MDQRKRAVPPETLEGWYALHQIFRRVPGAEWSVPAKPPFDDVAEGWTTTVQLIGSVADVMLIHFRPSLDEISVAEQVTLRSQWSGALERVDSFLSVTEAGLYHATAELARAAAERGGEAGDAEYQAAAAERASAEREGAHVRRRLYPERPSEMPFVSFYPMSKRRAPGQNWYALSVEERSRMMLAHGSTGRRYAGRVQQIITGSIGFEQWEWGVTLFARDPLDVKKLVTEMRFDEASAEYADFGTFYVGKVCSLEEILTR